MSSSLNQSFKQKYNFETRQNISSKVRSKQPNFIPIIIERADKSNISALPREKYLIPESSTIAKLLITIRGELKIGPEKAIFIFIGDKSVLPPVSSTIGILDSKYRDADGFLYIKYASENTFG